MNAIKVMSVSKTLTQAIVRLRQLPDNSSICRVLIQSQQGSASHSLRKDHWLIFTRHFGIFSALILNIGIACAQIPSPPGLTECVGNQIQSNCEQIIGRLESCTNYFGGSQAAGDSKYYQCTNASSETSCIANLGAQCILPKTNSSQSKN